MVPWLGVRQDIERLSGEDTTEFSEVIRDAFRRGWVHCRGVGCVGVLLECLCQPLGDGGGGSYFLWDSMQGGDEDPVTVLELQRDLILVIFLRHQSRGSTFRAMGNTPEMGIGLERLWLGSWFALTYSQSMNIPVALESRRAFTADFSSVSGLELNIQS